MRAKVVGSTKPGYHIQIDDILNFSGTAAGICYMPNNWQALQEEPISVKVKRVKACIKYGHHSVMDHVFFNFVFEDIPKFLAMILNNEKVYTTSEKSARYTIMKTSDAEGKLYQKWIKIFKNRIWAIYPHLSETQVTKLAQENARYLISVFTPATTMMHTISFRQLNLIIHWMKKYVDEGGSDEFSLKVKSVITEFLNTKIDDSEMTINDLAIENLNDGCKNRHLSIFGLSYARREQYGECYCTNYTASLAYFAQAQRHRTIYYEMSKPTSTSSFYIPPIISRTDYVNSWLEDIKSLKDFYPQGMLVNINERGTMDDFILKCSERLCGHAQLEIATQCKQTMKRYLEILYFEKSMDLYYRLLPYARGPRCTFPNWKCNQPCVFGSANALKRLI